MDFRQLKYLTAVAEYQSITKAAEALFISQPAMSHYIKKAEEEFGIQLFDRSTTPITLTYAGQKYMESAQRILLENDRLMKEFRDITHHMTGRLKVGTSRDRASYMLPRLVCPFRELYPGIELTVTTGSGQKLLEALRSGAIDLVLLPSSEADNLQGIDCRTIYEEELLLACAKGFFSSDRCVPGVPSAINPRALDGMPFFLLSQDHVARSFCDHFFRKNRIKPVIKMELASNITCYRMAATGDGLAIIPYMTTRLTCCEQPVDLYSLGSPSGTWNVQVMYRKDSYLGRPEQDFIRIAREVFSQESLSVKMSCRPSSDPGNN